tara:strand:+ start:516 stop:1022 length:507 start_codon:yes stop_codon:yes gene_type:complete
MDNIQIVILIIYTLAYIIVSFIQKQSINSLEKRVDNQTGLINNQSALINNQTGVINSMKSFMEIFDLKKIKEYVKVNEESAIIKASNFIADESKVKDFAFEFSKEIAEDVKKAQIEKIGEQHTEMIEVAFEVIKMIEPKDRERFVLEKLGKSKHIFIPFLDKIKNSAS